MRVLAEVVIIICQVNAACSCSYQTTDYPLPTATKVNGTRQKHFVKTTEAAATVRKVDQWICPFQIEKRKKVIFVATAAQMKDLISPDETMKKNGKKD